MERIHSLRKREDVLKENFEKRGLNLNISDIKFTYDEKENGQKTFEKFVSAVKRKKKKIYLESTKEEKLSYINEISFGMQKIQIEELYPADRELTMQEKEFNEYMTKLLRDCAKMFDLSVEKVKEKAIPVRVLYTKNGETKEGFSLLNGEFKKNIHGRGWKLRSSNYKYLPVFDLVTLTSEVLSINSLEQFVRNDEELVRYLVTKHIAEKITRREVTPVPTDETFATDLLKSMKKYGLVNGPTEKMSLVDPYKPLFYVEKDKDGYVRKVEHYLMQSVVVPEFVRQLEYVVEKTEEEMKERSEYARSFETKKHINKKTKKKMEDNAFLKKYKFVELDNEVDLELFSELEKEFILLDKKFQIPESRDHSFRIKRLGKHRAAGLYFPSFRATLIDVDSPESYIHELGHQIDYTRSKDGEMLSEKADFRGIIDRYKRLTQEQVDALPNEHPFKKMWENKGKYNKKYFWKTTEIFARSFELYLYSKNIRTSFLKKEYNSPEYPNQENFFQLIGNYFDELFGDRKPIVIDLVDEKPETKTEEAVEAKVKTEEKITAKETTEEKPKEEVKTKTPKASDATKKGKKNKKETYEQLSLFDFI